MPGNTISHQIMTSTVAIVAGAIAAFAYLFLRLLITWTQDVREPPAIETGLPFIGPLVGMIREKSRLHVRLRYAAPNSPPLGSR